MNWTDEISPQQWEEWMKLARKLSGAKKQATSLGYEDYAAQAIEKLIQQPNRPNNVEGWLSLTINRQYIDRFRKIQARGGASNRELSDEQWEEEMLIYAAGSPSALVRRQESVSEVLALLSTKERELLIMAAAGYDNHEIAMYLNYRTNKIVATRLKQIQGKVRETLDLPQIQ
jgi:DNA-directed RNA polymerase specialized sigma24 family protein